MATCTEAILTQAILTTMAIITTLSTKTKRPGSARSGLELTDDGWNHACPAVGVAMVSGAVVSIVTGSHVWNHACPAVGAAAASGAMAILTMAALAKAMLTLAMLSMAKVSMAILWLC